MQEEYCLQVEDLTIEYRTDYGIIKAVNHVSLNVGKGKTLGLVGETGAGKTTIALGICRLLQTPPAVVKSGKVVFEGQDIRKISESEMRKIRGDKITMIFQDPMTALNPVDTVGEQIVEVISLHNHVSKQKAAEMAGDTLEMVGIPRERFGDFPHQFSGGMKQRVVIAIALACNPSLLIADEPTTALDVTIQAQILHLINELKEAKGTSNLLITHDLGVIAEMCDNVAVIYSGEVVESGTTRQVFTQTMHPYTQGLFDSLPNINDDEFNRLKPIEGQMPDPANLPEGCNFADRCPYATEECRAATVPLVDAGNGHWIRCYHPLTTGVSK